MISVFVLPELGRPSSTLSMAPTVAPTSAGSAVATLMPEDIVEPKLVRGPDGEPPPKFRRIDPKGLGFVPESVSIVPSTLGVVVAGLAFAVAFSG